jgi:hypothetical protein
MFLRVNYPYRKKMKLEFCSHCKEKPIVVELMHTNERQNFCKNAWDGLYPWVKKHSNKMQKALN